MLLAEHGSLAVAEGLPVEMETARRIEERPPVSVTRWFGIGLTGLFAVRYS